MDGPSKEKGAAVPRHSAALNNLIVTPIVISKLPRAAGRGAVARAWEKAEVEKKWGESAWAKRREQREKRRNLSDFDRFKVLKLKKQVSCNISIPRIPCAHVSIDSCNRYGDCGRLLAMISMLIVGSIRHDLKFEKPMRRSGHRRKHHNGTLVCVEKANDIHPSILSQDMRCIGHATFIDHLA